MRDPAAVRSWLFSDRARKATGRPPRAAREPEPIAEPELVATGVDASDVFDDGIWRLVGSLPDKQRIAVGLRYLGDLSHAEIAEVMATSVEAARRNVFEGLRRLRDAARARSALKRARRAPRQKRRAAAAKRRAVSCSCARASPRRARSRSSRRPATNAAAGDPCGPISSSRSSATTVS